MSVTKRQVLGNFIWRYLERCSAQLVSFIVSIILARILGPEEYGTLALINVFINIFQVFATGGLGSALIQKKEPDELDFSTVFWSQMLLCIFFYIILFFVAPLISKFYQRIELIPMIRVSAISILIYGLRNIQLSYISKKMMFKKFFLATLAGTLLAAFVGIFLAKNGFGTWALIAQSLVNLFIDSILLWITSGWKPKFIFALNRFYSLFAFGIRNLLSSLIDTIYSNLRNLVISKTYTTSDLAFYTKGNTFPDFIVINIITSISSVLYPAFSDAQNDIARLKGMMRRALKIETYILSPLLFGLAACGETVVMLLLTDKWIPCVIFLQIFCISSLFSPISIVNLNAIHAMGRNDITLRLNLVKKIIGLIVLLFTVWISVKAIAIGSLICTVLFQILNSAPNKKLMGYTYREQMADILPNILLSFVMAVIVYLLNFVNINLVIKLLLQIFAGAFIYISLSWLLKIESFEYTKKHILKGFCTYGTKLAGKK